MCFLIYLLAFMNQSRMIPVASFMETPHINRALSENKSTKMLYKWWDSIYFDFVNFKLTFTNRLALSCIWISPMECCLEYRSMKIRMQPYELAYCSDFHWYILRRLYFGIRRIWIVIIRQALDWFYNHFQIFGRRLESSTEMRVVSLRNKHIHLCLEIFKSINIYIQQSRKCM